MFDFVPTQSRNERFVLARHLLFDHGHELAKAAAMLGGAPAEAMVTSSILQLQDAARITPRVQRNLVSLQRLLSLECVGDPDSLESAFFAEIDPACPEVEMICLLTDTLSAVLDAIYTSDGLHDVNVVGRITAA